MATSRAVNIGIIGTGFIAETRARCYAGVGGYQPHIVAAASRTRARADDYARRHGVPDVYDDYRRILDRADVDVVDLCVPNHLHRSLTEQAAAAGKHVIVSKPLTAFDGPGSIARQTMLDAALANATAMVSAAQRAGVQLMYAENWVYAPSIEKAARLAEASGGAILDMRGGECHSGSHSPYSKEWRYTGGGALLRLGVHALGAMLHLKRQEGMRRSGTPIRPRAVIAEVGDLTATPGFQAEDQHWIGSGWVDVENWGTAVVTFDDGTRGTVFASDAVLGGMESSLQVLLSNAHLKCNLSHNRLLDAFAPDPSVFGSAYLMEKLETSAGWSQPQPDEDWAQGHRAMIQDFVGAIAEGRPARSDGALGLDVIHVIYAAYVAAEEGRRVTVDLSS
ncbi:MAG TPA: Gfo/Idh/MocA family oxidoreductase [Chloroflexota bacterium]|jgi:predicted dehydrogenase